MEQPHAIHCLSAASGGSTVAVTKSRILKAMRRIGLTHAEFKLCGVKNELSSQTIFLEIIPECYLHLSMRMVTDKGSNKVSC